MHDVQELVEGYRRFLDTRYEEQADLYRDLAEHGQSPKTADRVGIALGDTA